MTTTTIEKYEADRDFNESYGVTVYRDGEELVDEFETFYSLAEAKDYAQKVTV